MAEKRALISVSDKAGIVDFASELVALGYKILSTGGTATALREAGLDVTDVSDITKFPESLDGRVKTLHPNIHAGILAIRKNDEHMKQLQELNIDTIDLVVINLYPFKETILKENVTREDAIENIDIGGPTMLRAAAKNWQDVMAVVNPEDYTYVIEELKKGEMSLESKFDLSCKVFEHTAAYDALIAAYMRKNNPKSEKFPSQLTFTYEKAQDMRYGENPHQQAAFYKEIPPWGGTLADAKQLHGKELSYNNINDANGALDTIKEFGTEKPCVVAVKHANPCGIGLGNTISEAYQKAYDADPQSIFGGIIALNREVDAETAHKISEIFLEIIIAPSYSPEALEILTQKKNIRLLELESVAKPNKAEMLDMKKVAGGLLVQELNTALFASDSDVVTKRAPGKEEMEQLQIAWRAVKHIKSNGICLVKGNQTVGVGPGQTGRITALELAVKYAGEKSKGSVMASDAFFPFSDCVEYAAKHGITAIIQPGGSVKDKDSIDACDKAGIAMIFTGIRHFKH